MNGRVFFCLVRAGSAEFRAGSLITSLLYVTLAMRPLLAETIVDFEDFGLPPNSAVAGNSAETPFRAHAVSLSTRWNHEFDCCPSGFAISTQTDVTTAGFENALSAVTALGGGANGSLAYAVANNGTPGEATIELDVAATVSGAYFTNSTYAYRAIIDGDDGGAGFIKGPFGDGDWFRLDVIGKDEAGRELGTIPIFLADYRDGRRQVVDDWTWVDLRPLGSQVKTMEFAMNSTDVSEFGINTPAYFAMDNLTLAPVPEPGSAGLLVVALFVLYLGSSCQGRFTSAHSRVSSLSAPHCCMSSDRVSRPIGVC